MHPGHENRLAPIGSGEDGAALEGCGWQGPSSVLDPGKASCWPAMFPMATAVHMPEQMGQATRMHQEMGQACMESGAVNPQMQMQMMQQRHQMQQMAQMVQMAQMAQMTQMAQMQHLQMASMMQMAQMSQLDATAQPMLMVPMGMVPVATGGCVEGRGYVEGGGKTDESDGEPLGHLTEEELGDRIVAQTAVVKDAERDAQKTVESGAYLGTFSQYDSDLGFGFVASQEVPRDSFIGQKNVIESGLEVGDVIVFKIEDNQGKPRVAMKPKVLKDVTKQKRKLAKLKDAAKAASNRSKMQAALKDVPRFAHVEAAGGAASSDLRRANRSF